MANTLRIRPLRVILIKTGLITEGEQDGFTDIQIQKIPTRITKKLLTKRRKFSRARNAAARIAVRYVVHTTIQRTASTARRVAISKGAKQWE